MKAVLRERHRSKTWGRLAISLTSKRELREEKTIPQGRIGTATTKEEKSIITRVVEGNGFISLIRLLKN